MSNCIYCNSSENLNTQLSLKLDSGTTATVSVCDMHAEEATIKSAREKYLEKAEQLNDFLEQAKQLGIDLSSLPILAGDHLLKTTIGSQPAESIPPAGEPQAKQPKIINDAETAGRMPMDGEDWISTEKFQKVSKVSPRVTGSAAGISNHASYDVKGDVDQLSEDLIEGKVKMAIAEGRNGQPLAIPRTRVDGTGTTNIRIVNQETDATLQNRFRQMAGQENSPDFRQGYQDTQRTCPICQGDCSIKGKDCPKCSGAGFISVY